MKNKSNEAKYHTDLCLMMLTASFSFPPLAKLPIHLLETKGSKGGKNCDCLQGLGDNHIGFICVPFPGSRF